MDLHLPRVERNDSGIYTCIIVNRFYDNRTSNGSNSIELLVQSRPIIETTHSKIATEIGQSVTMICRVSGQPMPIIYWMFHERVVPCDQIKNGSCYLRFTNIKSTDFGSYQCIAENLLGREEWIYSIVSRGMIISLSLSMINPLSSSRQTRDTHRTNCLRYYCLFFSYSFYTSFRWWQWISTICY